MYTNKLTRLTTRSGTKRHPMTEFYFAYGSNTQLAQMRARCPRAVPVGTATLRRYRLAFGGMSTAWGGAVATIEPAMREHVHGVVYRVTQTCLDALDKFEGAAYVRQKLRVRLDDNWQDMWTYEMVQPPAMLPTPEYANAITRGYTQRGLDTAPIARAYERAEADTRQRARVFVYGTLMRSESNHALLASEEFVGRAETHRRYTLVHLGHFPAMLRGGRQRVHGEVYIVSQRTLVALDRLEGHPHFYRRERIRLCGAEDAAGYVMADATRPSRRIIESGSWRQRRRCS